MVMAKTYLDENGNPVAAPQAPSGATYLDDNGNPIAAPSTVAPPASKYDLTKFATPSSASSEPGALKKAWDWANTGLISGKTIKEHAFYDPSKGDFMSEEELQHMADPAARVTTNAAIPEALRQKWMKAPVGSKERQAAYEQMMKIMRLNRAGDEDSGDAAARTFFAGIGNDSADMLSSFTSPASIAISAAGVLAKAPQLANQTAGIVPKLLAPLRSTPRIAKAVSAASKAGLTASGLTYGALGAKDTIEGLQEGITTPEGSRKVLGGTAAMLQSAPAIESVRVGSHRLAAKLLPNSFARGETAFLKTLNPGNSKQGLLTADRLRAAYRGVQSELTQRAPQNLEDLVSWADDQRRAIAQQTEDAITVQGGNINIDPNQIRNLANQVISSAPSLMLERVPEVGVNGKPTGRMVDGPRAQAVRSYLELASKNLRTSPQPLTFAEELVQDINAQEQDFYRMTKGEQRQALAEDPTYAAKFALKRNLQAQIENAIGNYKGLKQRYGWYKEIQNATDRRLNQLASQQPDSITPRTILRSAGAALGMAAGFGHGGRGFEGAAVGYKLGEAAGALASEKLGGPERLLKNSLQPPVPEAFSPQSRTHGFSLAIPPALRSFLNKKKDDENVNTDANAQNDIEQMLQMQRPASQTGYNNKVHGRYNPATGKIELQK